MQVVSFCAMGDLYMAVLMVGVGAELLLTNLEESTNVSLSTTCPQTSQQGRMWTSESKRFSISLFTASHCFLVGNRQTGFLPCALSSANLSAKSTLITLSRRADMASSVSLPSLTDPRILVNLSSFFCLSLMVSSSYVMQSPDVDGARATELVDHSAFCHFLNP